MRGRSAARAQGRLLLDVNERVRRHLTLLRVESRARVRRSNRSVRDLQIFWAAVYSVFDTDEKREQTGSGPAQRPNLPDRDDLPNWESTADRSRRVAPMISRFVSGIYYEASPKQLRRN